MTALTDVVLPRLLRVPDYQRGYAWEKQHVEEFLDVLLLLKGEQRHYTGTIVLLEQGPNVVDDNLQSLAPAEVVDGQQRLTTISLVLNEVRRLLAAEGQTQMADGLRRQFLSTTRDGVPVLRLDVQRDARPVWTALLHDQPPPVPDSLAGKRLLIATDLIRSEVRRRYDDGGIAALADLAKMLTTRLQFTLYLLEGHAEIGVVFETLNDRGKPLTELEKVKNYLLFLSARLPGGRRQGLAARINDAWSDVYRYLLEVAAVSSTGEDQFLRAHWLAAVDPVPVRWKGTPSVKRHFDRNRYVDAPDLLVDEVGAYVDSLKRAAQSFADSLRPDVQAFGQFGEQATIARAVHAQLARARTVAVFQPMMIALCELLPRDGQTYSEVMDLCLRFAVRTYLFRGYRADAGQTRLYRLAHEMWNRRMSPAELREALRRLVHGYADDDSVRAAMLDMEDNWYRWGGLRYFLYEYELHLLGGARPETDWLYFNKERREKTVEHILPQTAKDQYWTERFTKRERDRLTDVLGNLVLTRDNSSYSNKPFPDKRGAAGPGERTRPCYAQATLKQEQELARLSDWTPDTLRERQERLAAWALQRWAVEPPRGEVAATNSTTTTRRRLW